MEKACVLTVVLPTVVFPDTVVSTANDAVFCVAVKFTPSTFALFTVTFRLGGVNVKPALVGVIV